MRNSNWVKSLVLVRQMKKKIELFVTRIGDVVKQNRIAPETV